MEIILRGEKDTVLGNFPKIGELAPDFQALNLQDQPIILSDYKGEVVLLNVFPDIDTGVCSLQTSRFNEMASSMNNVKIISISTNTKEQQENWCAGRDISMEVVRDTDRSFGKAYGVLVEKANKLGRSVFVVNREGKLVYSEIIQNMSDEPDYEQALEKAKETAAE